MFGGTAEAALPFACAIEMIHAYSLVHDDMPCMDNDDMRRGKPSCHRAYGEANALLAGDTLLTQAFEVAALNPHVSDRARVLAVRALAQGAGALGMAGGQYYDLSDRCDTYEELYRLQSMKTGALIRTACLIGYYAAVDAPTAADEANLARYAEGIGFAFQIVDDILDVTGDEKTLGLLMSQPCTELTEQVGDLGKSELQAYFGQGHALKALGAKAFCPVRVERLAKGYFTIAQGTSAAQRGFSFDVRSFALMLFDTQKIFKLVNHRVSPVFFLKMEIMF
jgi:hypothetical protein